MKTLLSIAAGLALAALAANGATAQEPAPAPSKIRGDVYFHRSLKQKPPGRSDEEHRRILRALRLDADDLEREEVALYVGQELAPAEKDGLRAQGVDVHPELWIPPVGRHPLGFHVAEVPYDRLGVLAADPRIVRVESIERRNELHNDVGGALINVDDVHAGAGVPARTGAGVKLVVIDSALQVTHPDIPAPVETFDMTTGTGVSTWSTSVAGNDDHGTHVAATAVGTASASVGQYIGAAPDADFYFYKVMDASGGISTTDILEAFARAQAVGADVVSMSIGGLSSYMDGTDSMSQAAEAAVASGATVLVSAGNEADNKDHYSVAVQPLGVAFNIDFTVTNPSAASASGTQQLLLNWIDGVDDDNVRVTVGNLGAGESLDLVWSAKNPVSDTEAKQYTLNWQLAGSQTKTYELRFWNDASTGVAPLVHCWAYGGTVAGTFVAPDPGYTVMPPALADTVIAVGATVHRTSWTNYQGTPGSYGQVGGGRATFSSMGPRIDGLMKPDLAAPGTATISAQYTTVPVSPIYQIDPAGYYSVKQGTSMSCPMAAGVAALVLEENPSLTPAQVRSVLTGSGTAASNPTNGTGHGRIDALLAVQNAHPGEIYVDGSYVGPETGAPATPFNTVAEALALAAANPDSTLFLAAGTYPSSPLSVGFAVRFVVWGTGPVFLD